MCERIINAIKGVFKKPEKRINHLERSFIYGIDDTHLKVSPHNRMINADLGPLEDKIPQETDKPKEQ